MVLNYFLLAGLLLLRKDPVLVDAKATKPTKALYVNLEKLQGKGILFGHQHATDYGVGWKDDPARSDVKDVCGQFPGLYGWDLGRIVTDLLRNGDLHSGEPGKVRKLAVAAYSRGGVNTFSWHMANLATGKNFYDTTRAVYAMLPGGALHEQFKRSLDTVAFFLNSLKAPDGTMVPVIFRPWHEHNGSWFWWGAKYTTVAEYQQLFRFTVTYLRDVKQLHHLLYSYSPDRFNGIGEYLERYPGDEYVDILGFDDYGDFSKPENFPDGISSLKAIAKYADSRHKLFALTETGIEKVPDPRWYTSMFNAIKADPDARRISYFLVWRNADTAHFYAPYPGHTSAPDFVQFYNDPMSYFENDLKHMYKW